MVNNLRKRLNRPNDLEAMLDDTVRSAKENLGASPRSIVNLIHEEFGLPKREILPYVKKALAHTLRTGNVQQVRGRYRLGSISKVMRKFHMRRSLSRRLLLHKVHKKFKRLKTKHTH